MKGRGWMRDVECMVRSETSKSRLSGLQQRAREMGLKDFYAQTPELEPCITRVYFFPFARPGVQRSCRDREKLKKRSRLPK